MYNILFDIGDYSCDGHNYYATFMVKSNKTDEELQKIHLKENDFIGSLCEDYEENYIYIYELYNFLIQYLSPEKAMNFLNDFTKETDTKILVDNDFDDEVTEMSIEEEDYHSIHMNNAKSMLDMWLRLLKVIDNTFEYEIISEAMSSYYIKYKGYPVEPSGKMIPRNYNGMKIPGYGVWKSDDDSEFHHD